MSEKVSMPGGFLTDAWILSAVVWIASVWLGAGTPIWIVNLAYWVFWLLLLPVIIIFIVAIIVLLVIN